MGRCSSCGAPTANPKFCSRSCAASFHNRARPKRTKVERCCLECGAVVASNRTYCDFACQQQHARRARIDAWLSGGVVHVGTGVGHYIRAYLLVEQARRCALCGHQDEWCDQPLHFVLDHIDGDPTHNARENLRLICPNCDSQLPTYKGRNRGRGRESRRERYRNGQSY